MGTTCPPQLHPRLPGVPAFRNCALASSKVATRSERVIGPVNGERPEPAQMIGTTARLIDAADRPSLQ